MNNGENLTRKFKRSELACPCCGQCQMNQIFMDRLQVLRDLYGKPITIVSGYRCAKHNKEIRGSPQSDHLRGEAVDIRVRDKLSRELYRLRELAFKLEFNGIGIGKNHFHIGIRSGDSRSWNY